MTIENVGDPKVKPGAQTTMRRVAEFVQPLTGIPGTHLEITSEGHGEGTEELTVEIKSDLPGDDGQTLATIVEPI